MDLLPSMDEVEEMVKNEPILVRKTSSRAKGVFKRGKEDLLHDVEKEKFLENVDWNDLEITSEMLALRTDRNQKKFDKLKNTVTEKEYTVIVEALALFICRCIPKPFKSISNRSNYNGWALSCMASTFGSAGVSTLNVGKHVVANVSKVDSEIFFTIYIIKDDLENMYGTNFEKLNNKYLNVEVGPVEDTVKGREMNLFYIVFQIDDFIKEIDNQDLILAIRKVTTRLICESKTAWARHQSENFIQDVLEKIVKK